PRPWRDILMVRRTSPRDCDDPRDLGGRRNRCRTIAVAGIVERFVVATTTVALRASPEGPRTNLYGSGGPPSLNPNPDEETSSHLFGGISMNLFKASGVLVALALSLLWAAPASAQATRTWISGVGSDANPCSRTAPCKTWAGAISKTAAGGEIDALDPGGFGAVTITKAITLDGGGGQVASTLAASTNGIVVQAGVS